MEEWLMRPIPTLLTLFFLFLTQASAERVPLSAGQKTAEATNIVTGIVRAVYGRETETARYGQGTLETHFLLEIEVEAVEKGDGLKKGDLVYARCWRLKKRGAAGALPGPSGHFGIPRDGEKVRAFLARGRYSPTGQTDQGWAVVYPNGIDKLPAK
jgi:hypothetical protein